MIKKLLSCVAVMAATLSASAGDVTVWEGSQTFESWSNNIQVAANEFSFVSEGDVLVISLTDVCKVIDESWATITVKTNTEGWPQLNGTDYSNPSADATSFSFDINATAAEELKATGLILQGTNFTATKIVVKSAADVNPNILFEGETTIKGWNKAGDFAASKVKVGDIVRYTFTDPGTSSSQILVKNSSWANLLGTAKMNYNDLKVGHVDVGVTQEMLDNCGGTIFVQGDGGVVLTKVEILAGESFNADGVLAYGSRIPGCDCFITIPEDATTLYVTFESTPTWFQLCNSSWTSLVDNGSATLVSGNVYALPLTADVITAINENKEAIINTDANVLSISTVDPTKTGIAAIAAESVDAPVEYYNLQGVRVANPENGGLYIRRQGNNVTKVIVK